MGSEVSQSARYTVPNDPHQRDYYYRRQQEPERLKFGHAHVAIPRRAWRIEQLTRADLTCRPKPTTSLALPLELRRKLQFRWP